MKAERLKFGGREWDADVRMLSDIKDVVYDQDWIESHRDEEIPLYYMYRGLYERSEEEKTMEEHHLRYDITIIPPLTLGREYVKTAGHYHPPVPGGELSYTEIYQVLEGTAEYLLQKVKNGIVEDVVLIHATKGNIVIIPPNYGHITINKSKNNLKMSNWVSSEFTSIYEPMRERKGGAYYLLKDETILRNENYTRVPELRRAQPTDPSLLNLRPGEDMYRLIETPERLDFLKRPEEYRELFVM
ncbi:Glucose-6-phosphate isomerase [Candidatus Methanoperedenaceae archaeon GB50]|nr:Glucose-6-phosphate isomerase [Candidatus Methanoperedenaceae archaeon GB50]CAD7780609.1 MAG: Glucose-6-phosphate isomerase [Candidatus Methanoperedenaceae archaeon GB50]